MYYYVFQLAAAVCAEVMATSCSDARLEIAKKPGATHTINYLTTLDWEQEGLRLITYKRV